MKFALWLSVVLISAGLLWFLSGQASTSTAVTVGIVIAGGIPLTQAIRTLWLQRTGRLNDPEEPEAGA